MQVRVIQNGQEIDIKDVNPNFIKEIGMKNPFLGLLLSTALLKSLEQEEIVDTVENTPEEELFKKSEENIEDIAQCSGNPDTCERCGESVLNDFSDALEALKEGYKVTRKSWVIQGKSRYLYYVAPGVYPARTNVAREEFGEEVPYSGYIALKTDLGYVTPYTPTNPDLLAEDWLVISNEQ